MFVGRIHQAVSVGSPGWIGLFQGAGANDISSNGRESTLFRHTMHFCDSMANKP